MTFNILHYIQSTTHISSTLGSTYPVTLQHGDNILHQIKLIEFAVMWHKTLNCFTVHHINTCQNTWVVGPDTGQIRPIIELTFYVPLDTKWQTSGQRNLTKRPHHRRTWTVQSYMPSGVNVQPIYKCFLGPTRVHIPKWHLNRFSRFCTAHGRQSLYLTMGHPFPPQNCPFVRGIWPHLIMLSWAHLSPQPKWHLNQFSGFCRVQDRDRQTALHW